MKLYEKLFIDGAWVEPSGPGQRDMIDPATEEPFASVATGGTAGDVDRAVAASAPRIETFSRTSLDERIALIDRVIAAYEERVDEFAAIVAQEVGAPVSGRAQATGPIGHMRVARDLMGTYHFESRMADTIIRREPIGVCALISPWNWPVQTPVIKIVFGARRRMHDGLQAERRLAHQRHHAGGGTRRRPVCRTACSTSSSARAGSSARPWRPSRRRHGVFHGFDGGGHQSRRGRRRTVKRVSLELGGKSANIVLTDADLERAARWNIQRCFTNTGQSCHAPSRMLVHRKQMASILPYLVDEVSDEVPSWAIRATRKRPLAPWSTRRSSTVSSAISKPGSPKAGGGDRVESGGLMG